MEHEIERLRSEVERLRDVERLAAIQHEIWSHWMSWFFENDTTENRARWQRQMVTAYADLSESEKESDRRIVREFCLRGEGEAVSDPFRDRSEILDGPPSIGDRVVEQAEYIRLLEEKLAEAKNRHAEHLAAHRTADAHDCAEMEEMYQRKKAEVERLQAEVERLRTHFRNIEKRYQEKAEATEAEVERLREALNALVIVNGSEIGYRTMHNIPMAMSKRIERKIRAALRGKGEK